MLYFSFWVVRGWLFTGGVVVGGLGVAPVDSCVWV